MFCTAPTFRSTVFRFPLLFAMTFLLSLFGLIPAARSQVTVNGNAKTKNIYSYIKNLKSKGASNRVLLGQNAGPNGNEYTADFNYLIGGYAASSGKEFALVSSDLGEFPANVWDIAGALDWYGDRGRILSASWHLKNPWTGGSYRDRTGGNLKDLLPGGAKRAVWQQQLKEMADVLAWLRDQNQTVLWRPFHEMNGNWFWWCDRNADDYKALWKDMYAYFTTTRGLNNLIWVYAPNNTYSGSKGYYAYYPGDSYVDIVGVDVYNNAFAINDYATLKTTQKPLIVSEIGPDPSNTSGWTGWWNVGEKLKNSYPEVVAAIAWWDWKSDGNWTRVSVYGPGNDPNGQPHHQSIPYHGVIISLDEVPAF